MSGHILSKPVAAPVGVLFLVRALHTGGAERQLVLLAKAMHLRGTTVAVAVYEDSGGYHAELVQAGVPVHVLGRRGRWDILGLLLRLRRLVRTLRPQVVYAYMSHSNLLLLLLKPTLGRTRAICGVRSSGLALATYSTITRWGEKLHTRLLRYADLVICNSRAAQRELVDSGMDAARCAYVANGIDTTRFRRDTSARRRLRDEWSVEPDAPVVGLVGRLHPMKNHAGLLRAVARLVGRWPRLRVVFVGDGSLGYRQQLQRAADDLRISDRVLWAGRQDDMAAVYSALDVLCLPSTWGEGFPNVVGEAMSCGLPCVVSDVGDGALIVGEHGWAVQPGNEQELADALAAAVSSLAEWDPAAPRDWIVREFSIERLVKTTVAAMGLSEGGRRCVA